MLDCERKLSTHSRHCSLACIPRGAVNHPHNSTLWFVITEGSPTWHIASTRCIFVPYASIYSRKWKNAVIAILQHTPKRLELLFWQNTVHATMWALTSLHTRKTSTHTHTCFTHTLYSLFHKRLYCCISLMKYFIIQRMWLYSKTLMWIVCLIFLIGHVYFSHRV